MADPNINLFTPKNKESVSEAPLLPLRSIKKFRRSKAFYLVHGNKWWIPKHELKVTVLRNGKVLSIACQDLFLNKLQ